MKEKKKKYSIYNTVHYISSFFPVDTGTTTAVAAAAP